MLWFLASIKVASSTGLSDHCKGMLIRHIILLYTCSEWNWALYVNTCSFSEFSRPKNERELHFLKITWKILASSPSNVHYLKWYFMHISDLTLNQGYLSLVNRYWDFKSYSQIAPLNKLICILIPKNQTMQILYRVASYNCHW